MSWIWLQGCDVVELPNHKATSSPLPPTDSRVMQMLPVQPPESSPSELVTKDWVRIGGNNVGGVTEGATVVVVAKGVKTMMSRATGPTMSGGGGTVVGGM
jgi:hypothetical protein